MRVLTRALAATTLVAAAGLAVAPGAAAAACAPGDGVTVVVDYARSGGSGTAVSCVGDGGGQSASTLFGSAGHDLTRVSSQPGAVCKVDGYRTQDACQRMPPANAYWGLFWSDGEGGWVYSQEGVDNLDVPAGGSVAWAWQNGGGYDYPGVAPTQQTEPAEGPTPSQPPAGDGGGSSGGNGGSGGGSGPSGSGTPDASATTSPTGTPSASADGDRRGRGRAADAGTRDRPGPDEAQRQDRRDDAPRDGKRDRDRQQDRQQDGRGEDEPGSEATVDAEAPATAAEPPADAGQDGLPVWVGPAAVGLLLPAAGLAAYLRRRSA